MSAATRIIATVSSQDDMFRWISEFPLWKQELFRRASAKPGLLDEDVDVIVALLLDPAGRPEVAPLARSEIPGGVPDDAALSLLSIFNVQGVNALARGQRLDFLPAALNVVYGANGAGKTGYSRVLKHAGRALHRDPVRGHVGNEEDLAPRAVLTVSVDDDREDVPLALDRPAPGLLSQLCVHDEKCGARYVSDETAMDYAPRSVEYAERFGNGLAKVAQRLDEMIAAAKPAPLDLAAFGEDTAVRQLLDAPHLASAASVIDLANISDADEAEAQEAQALLSTHAARQAALRKEAAEREVRAAERLAADLHTVWSQIQPSAIAEITAAHDDVAEFERASQLAATQFGELAVPGIGGAPWHALWEAARTFVAGQGSDWPPGQDDPSICPLCLQDLTTEGHERMAAFERFVTDDINQRLTAARQRLARRTTMLPDVAALRATHAQAIDAMAPQASEQGKALDDWLLDAECVVDATRGGTDAARVCGAPPTADVDAFIAGRNEEIELLTALEQPNEEERLRAVVDEWQARTALASRRSDVLAYVGSAARVHQLRKARAEANTQGISLRVGHLTDTFVRDELKEALSRQLDRLAFSSSLEVVPDSRVSQGTPRIGLRLQSAKGVPLADVLSVGEQRRLALAMCLAEMSVGHSGSPLVLDDPVCSIDQEGRRHVARELVGLAAAGRQVIVFTHELSFVVELRAAAEQARVQLHAQHLVRHGGTTGHVRPHLPWEGLRARDRIQPLESKLDDARQYHGGDDAAYALRARDFCNFLRQGYERLVEDDVLAGTVTRRQIGVKPSNLGQIIYSDEIVRLVDRGIGENSRLLHAAAVADGSVPLTPNELAEELDQYRELLDLLRRERRERETAITKAKTHELAQTRSADTEALRPKLSVVPAAVSSETPAAEQAKPPRRS